MNAPSSEVVNTQVGMGGGLSGRSLFHLKRSTIESKYENRTITENPNWNISGNAHRKSALEKHRRGVDKLKEE